MDMSEKVLHKLYAGVLGALATIVVQKLMSAGWKLATGEEPPEPGDPNVPANQAFIWALSSAVGVGAAQLAMQRMTSRRWLEMGHAPKPTKTKFKV